MKKMMTFMIMLSLLAGCSKSTLPVTNDTEVNSLSNKKLEWGLKRNKNAVPDINPGSDEILQKYDAYYLGDPQSKDIYLTFDEGYENGYTAQILDVLKKEKVPACFFVTGPYVKQETELIKRMVNEGHEVGNHTVNHPSMPSVQSTEKLEQEMLDLDRMFYDTTGRSMKFMRPPMGEFSERTLAVTQRLGYKTVFWSIAYMDWDINKQPGSEYVYRSVLDYLHGGAVILMHAVSRDNANTLERIIRDAKAGGYTFQPLTALPSK